jgi:hypothetical protein
MMVALMSIEIIGPDEFKVGSTTDLMVGKWLSVSHRKSIMATQCLSI